MADRGGSSAHRAEVRRRDPLWPSLFGRATLLAGNERLGPVLAALRAASNRDADGVAGSTAKIRGLLTAELRAQLAQHFGTEESESYFGLIVRETPWLGREIAGLKLEHAKLLTLLSALIMAATRREPVKVLAWQAEHITQLLQAHERKEGSLLRRFLLSDDAE